MDPLYLGESRLALVPRLPICLTKFVCRSNKTKALSVVFSKRVCRYEDVAGTVSIPQLK